LGRGNTFRGLVVRVEEEAPDGPGKARLIKYPKALRMCRVMRREGPPEVCCVEERVARQYHSVSLSPIDGSRYIIES
jgi:hypothetical protein